MNPAPSGPEDGQPGQAYAATASPYLAEMEQGFVFVPVLSVVDQTPDIRSFRLARPKSFDFRAGQYLTLAFGFDGQRVSRPFSISSAPEARHELEITVKRTGPVSSAVYSTLGVERFASIRPPEGGFVYPDGDERPLVLVAGGVGCAPLMSMLRHAAVRDPARQVTYLLSVRTAADIAFQEELARLRKAHSRFRIGVTLTRDRRPELGSGRIGEALLRRAAPDPANTVFRLCGPPPMTNEMRRLLEGLGVPGSQIRWEVFAPTVVASRAESTLPARPPAPVVAPVRAPVPGPVTGRSSSPPRTLPFARRDQVKQVLRFAKGEMALHWAIAIPFMLCFATGITMKIFYDLRTPSLFREFLSVFHRVAGCALAVLPALAIARNWRDYKVHIYNVKVGFSWTIDDLKWLFLVGPATVSKRVVLPEQRKFNAGEKLNFMMVMVTYPLFLATGFLLWMTGDHFLPWVVHISMSLTAPLLMMGHIYMAVVNPDTRVGLSGMITGRVDREWAKHHYRRWYQEHYEEDGTPKAQAGGGGR